MKKKANPSWRKRHAAGTLAAALAVILVLAGCSSSSSNSSDAGASGSPKKGGSLTVGVVGGSAKDSLDAHKAVTHPDEARVIQLYDTLLFQTADFKFDPGLATSVTSDKSGKVWTIKLRDGIKFSDGRPITVDDVIATFKRISDPAKPTNATSGLAALERDGFVKVDDRTVEFHFSQPVVNLQEQLAAYSTGVVPADYDPLKPIGAGPFMLKSFTPGQQSVFVRNPNYWRNGQPYLDSVTIIDFPDDTARVNALLSGQVDAIDQLPLGQVQVASSTPGIKILESKTSGMTPFTMRVDQAPFTDVRVRQAFRLIVDRKQMVQQVLAGHGEVGNDMYSRFDPCYPKDIPQRTQDIAKAKQLLKEAGQSNLTVDLVTSPVAAGLVEAAQVFAQQAKAAGVTVNVKKVDPGEFYGDQYLSWTFAQDFFFTHSYLGQALAGSTKNAPYNETHWADAQWDSLVATALQTTDDSTRCGLIKQASQIEYDRGGYIIWGFPNSLDAYKSKVVGFVPDKSGIPLTSYRFRTAWLNG